MALIPYAVVFKATVHGSVPKLVECEQCQFEYVYVVTRTAEAEQTSSLFFDTGGREEAEQRAAAYLQEGLDQACEVVPCPKCGWVQEHMVERARELHHLWLEYLARGLVLTGAFSASAAVLAIVIDLLANDLQITWVSIVPGLVTAVGLGCGIPLWVYRRRLARRYHPNNLSLDKRKRMGQRFALGKAEFIEKMQDPW